MADSNIPTEALEAAARDLAGRVKPSRHGNLCPVACVITPIDNCDCWILTQARADVAIVAPHLIAEGRRQGELHALKAAEEAILSEPRPNPVLDSNGVVLAAAVVRRLAARIAEGLTPVDRADKHLRESRERQAGLDYERIERKRLAEDPDLGPLTEVLPNEVLPNDD